MELFISINFQVVLLLGLTIRFISDGIPIRFQQINRNNSNFWIFDIGDINTVKEIIYLTRKL